MSRFAWMTDIHLNFLKGQEMAMFFSEVRALGADGLLLGGDIGEADSVLDYLAELNDALAAPLYFVLGNHDFYGGSIRQVRRGADALAHARPRLHYLTTSEYFTIAPGVALLGHDGWADGRVGNYERSLVMMNDYKLIGELAPYNKRDRLAALMALGDEAADHARRVLPAALQDHQKAIFLTHVPPLREACWYQGQISDDQWSPHFTCLALGHALLEVMRERPDRQLLVLCGHTHSPGRCRPQANVEIITGGAEYGFPSVEKMLDL